ncbi:MAG: aminoacyl-tRNA deacylase [Acetivibrionales bacterium]|jgi:Cys-tRNA(Pro)/Cys-tRNA(Cys) deacylase
MRKENNKMKTYDEINNKEYEDKLKLYISNNNVMAKQLVFKETCHSVQEAAAAANTSPENFIKSICMIKPDGKLVVGIVKGEDRVSTSRVAKVLGVEEVRIATPEEILDKTGYICGGVPGFGYDAIFLIDPKVMEMETIITGGGSSYSLLEISPKEMHRLNKGQVIRIRK